MKRKIYIGENKLSLLQEGLTKLKLPQFIFQRVKIHNTSLGENEAFPPEGDYAFDYKILKQRYEEVVTAFHNAFGNSISEENATNELKKCIKRCQDIEKPFRENLEKLCENIIYFIFDVPQETVNFKCQIVDKVKPTHSQQVMPEDEDNTDYDFEDLNEYGVLTKDILKRRMIDALIQGASYEYTNYYHIAETALSHISNELIDLYDKITILNDYLLFTKQENITDKNPMQGGYVETMLGRGDEKTDISSQGLIFPFMLNESIRGFFELFASRGLPTDVKKANYILGKSEFLIAEPWDLRLGVKLWEYFSEKVEDTKDLPYIFATLCELETNEFNDTLKEIYAKTKKGRHLLDDLCTISKHRRDMESFIGSIDKKNASIAVINDNYISADELDDYVLQENDDKTNNDCPLKSKGWNGNCDYLTILDGELNEALQSFCIPFINLDGYGIAVGEEGYNHRMLIDDVNGELEAEGYDEDELYNVEEENWDNDTTGRIHIIQDSQKFQGYSVFTFWWKDHAEKEKSYFEGIAQEVCKQLNLDFNKSCVAIGGDDIVYSTIFFEGKAPHIELPNQEKLHAKHLDPNKWEETADFRADRGEKWGEKLAYRDAEGNRIYDKEPMSLAQYYSLIRTENTIKENKKHVTFDNSYYMHKSQAAKEIPQDQYQKALEILQANFPDYDYWNCIMYKPSANVIRFDYSEDFDTCTEPGVKRRVTVNYIDETATDSKRQGVDVWHGKADFWVDDGYKGFDIAKEKEWRQRYLDAIKQNPQFGASPHGESRGNWLNHLIDLGLIDEYFERNGITDPIEYLKANSTGKFKKGLLLQKYEEYKKTH